MNKEPFYVSIKLCTVRKDEYSRLVRDNQMMVQLLERALNCLRQDDLREQSLDAMASDISKAVDKVRHPLLPADICHRPDKYAQAMLENAVPDGHFCDVPIYIDPTLEPDEIQIHVGKAVFYRAKQNLRHVASRLVEAIAINRTEKS